MLFEDNFFHSLPDESNAAIVALVRVSDDFYARVSDEGWGDETQEQALELLATVEEFAHRFKLKLDLPPPDMHPAEIGQGLRDVLLALQHKATKELQKNRILLLRQQVKARFPDSYALEFTDGDLERIQKIINELRDHVASSKNFEESHKQRVLRRLERLQGELHKRMSDADRIFGLIGDAGVAIGKFGKSAKPIVDRIRELAEIAWKAQARAEELPSDAPFPMLENKK
jgi:hypothetical protein